MGDRASFNLPVKASLECQILVFASSFDVDFSQLDSPHKDTEGTGNGVLSGTVIGMKPQRGRDAGHT